MIDKKAEKIIEKAIQEQGEIDAEVVPGAALASQLRQMVEAEKEPYPEQPTPQPAIPAPEAAVPSPTAHFNLAIDVRRKIVVLTINAFGNPPIYIGLTPNEGLQLAAAIRKAANQLGQVLHDVERLKNKKPKR